MSYILQGVSDIEKLLVEDLEGGEILGYVYSPKLPISSIAIRQSLGYSKVIAVGDQGEREPLSITEYNPNDKMHFCTLNYDVLDKKLDSDQFQKELAVSVKIIQQNYLSPL